MRMWPGIIRISLPPRVESREVAPVNRPPRRARARGTLPQPVPAPPAPELRRFIRFCRDALLPLIDRCAGVTPTELRVLNGLRSERGDCAAVTAKRLGMDRGQISRLLTRLEIRGLVAREKRAGRATPLRLTPSGRALVDKANWAEASVIEAMLNEMTADDHRRLREAMAAVEGVLGVG